MFFSLRGNDDNRQSTSKKREGKVTGYYFEVVLVTLTYLFCDYSMIVFVVLLEGESRLIFFTERYFVTSLSLFHSKPASTKPPKTAATLANSSSSVIQLELFPSAHECGRFLLVASCDNWWPNLRCMFAPTAVSVCFRPFPIADNHTYVEIRQFRT